MSAHTHYPDALKAQNSGFNRIPDPGASGTISLGSITDAVCLLRSAGAESRTLAIPSGSPIGAKILLVMEVDNGTIGVSQAGTGQFDTSANTIIQFNDPLDWAELVLVSYTADSTPIWRIANSSGVTLA